MTVGNSDKSYTSASTLVMCCTAAMISETVTYPLDMLKTRIQVFAELRNQRSHPGIFKLAWATIRTEGFFQLWQGLSPALVRHLIYTGSRVPVYEIIRRDVFDLPPAAHFAVKSDGTEKNYPPPDRNPGFVVRAAFAGVMAGAFAQFLASPTDLVKVRLQTEMKWRTEAALSAFESSVPSSSASLKRLSFVGCLKQLYSEGGPTALWRGGLANVQRAALVNMGELTTYDTAKRWFAIQFRLKDGPLLHICASTMSGFVAALLGTPADLIKTRIMNQRGSLQSNELLYNGVVDCACKIVKTEGLLALYKGFFLIWARLAPWSLTFWLTYEKIRTVCGVGGF
ncbi:hypothetical protein CRM22_000390 [Opisthorchis felineus]|uniref:Mitochondrial uncoupling protein 4 n=1 Tax=Opisthorchis felineus TaxID=147828 RepID=A0A4S2MFQ0_OPIFE|nr:hypothetical protein CRM22_000390 [Opisthorchis felineus]